MGLDIVKENSKQDILDWVMKVRNFMNKQYFGHIY